MHRGKHTLVVISLAISLAAAPAASAATNRVSDGLQLLYDFLDLPGNTIADVSGTGIPLDLSIQSTQNVVWLPEGGLRVDGPVVIAGSVPGTELQQGVASNGEVSVEAWIKPWSAAQSGPAPIVSFGESATNRNVMLGQDADVYSLLLRTSQTGPSGIPHDSSVGNATTQHTHVVTVRDASGTFTVYINGQQAASAAAPGDFGTWDPSHLIRLAGEPGGTSWFGEMHMVAMYDRALGAGDVQQNYDFGPRPTPFFSRDPEHTAVEAPQPAVFSVTVHGSSPLSYQWRRDGAPIVGETSPSYGILRTTAADHGAAFDCMVSNSYGTATSHAAILTILGEDPTHPAILVQPEDATVEEPDPASFALLATGAQPLFYQWRRNGTNIVGATSTPYRIEPTVRARDDKSRFDCIVSNTIGVVTSRVALLTVNENIPDPPTIVTPPRNTVVTEPGSALFRVTAGGDPPLSYQWRRDEAAIPDGTNRFLSILKTSHVLDDGARFDVIVSNPYGVVTSAFATLTVISTTAPPTIISQPLDVTVTEPDPAGFTVVAQGPPSLIYQWRRNGTNISGAIYDAYALAPTDADRDDGALFDVVVSNPFGAATSGVARLTVNADELPPSIFSQPDDLTVTEPDPAGFSVFADGTPPLSYQWRRNGTDIPGAASTGYVLNPTSVSDSGVGFSVVISSPHGSVTSRTAVLTVDPEHVNPPEITAHPTSARVNEPDPVGFSVLAMGDSPLSFQWRRDGTDIPGATLSGFVLSTTSMSDSGAQFDVVVSNPHGTAISDIAVLTVDAPDVGGVPTITVHPIHTTVTAPNPAGFSVLASGTPPVSYQWRRNRVPISGANISAHVVNPTSADDSGARFDVIVSNPSGSVTSHFAVLTVFGGPNSPPTITDHPDSVAVVAPDPASFSVTASGDQPLFYQWRRETVSIPGAMSSVYTLDPTIEWDDQVGFDVLVSNAYGLAVSDTATLSVTITNRQAPVFDPLATPSVAISNEVTLSVSATDADGQIPTLFALTKPAGAQFVDYQDGSGMLTWTPDGAAGVGAHAASFLAWDGRHAVTSDATIYVRSFTVTSPSASSIVRMGEPWTIAWQGAWPLGVVTVTVWDGSGLVATLWEDVFASTAEISWSSTVPTNMIAGGHYWVRVVDVDTPDDFCWSERVTVQEKDPGLWDGADNLGDEWRYLEWFGIFNIIFDPWILHLEHGWMSALGNSLEEGVWFYALDLEWIWTSRPIYPFIYWYREQTWLYYVRDSTPRWFYHYGKGEWINM